MSKILLESGTNELEILEFVVGGNYYGINVAKVKEILNYEPLTPVPNSHPCIEGAFMTRGETLSIINLAKAIGMREEVDERNNMFLITNFNHLGVGFHVHGVVGIHRVSWSQIIKPDSTISSSDKSVVTGIINLDGKLVVILDFEKIVAEITPETGMQLTDVERLGARKKNAAPIIYAEDSQLLSLQIYEALTKAGYTRVLPMNNGLEVWNLLQDYIKAGTLEENCQCIITDIEMPQMDGHRLLKLVKEDPVLRDIPVIIFSSLINEEMKKKGEELGADAQLSKSELGKFIHAIDRILGERTAAKDKKEANGE